MKVFSPFLNGDTTTSGSLTLPRHPISSSITNTSTGSIYYDTTDNVVKVYTGNAWEIVGEQTTPSPTGAVVEYLLVAGGGGGGGRHAGGGGAGGYLSSSLASVQSGSSFTITVGSGGSGGPNGTTTGKKQGTSGTNSTIAGTTITTITAIAGGGGGGDADDSNPPDGLEGLDGGSGGGASYQESGGSGTAGQGFAGGDGQGSPNYSGGGGGGASAVGVNASGTNAGGGGSGLSSTITGTSVTRAGGGGAGGWSGVGSGAGGNGGGGTGVGNAGSSNAGAGTVNTGGGGGGGGGESSAGGSGGSGVAIFAYPTGSINGAGGIVGTTPSQKKYHQFNSSGTLSIGAANDFQIHTTNLVMHVDAGNFASRNGNTSGIDLSSYSNNLNFGGQSGGSLTANPWWNCDGTGGLADFERNGGSTASNVAHTGYGSMTGASNNAWTIEFWIKTTATGGEGTLGKTIIGTNASSVWAGVHIVSNKLAYMHYDTSWLNSSSTTSINDGNWHHCVVANYSNETCDLYVDGTREVTGANSALTSGRYMKMDSLGRGYNGQNTSMDIGQLRVYDAPLSAAQVLQNYNATKTNFI